MLREQTVARLVVGVVNIDVAAGGQLVVGGQPRHLLLHGVVPQGGVGRAPGAGDALDVLFEHQVLADLRAKAGIVVEVFVVVDAPIAMEAGVHDDPVVLADLKAVLLAGVLHVLGRDDAPDLAHLGGVAAGGVELLFEVIVHPGHVQDDAGADAMLQRQLGQRVAIALAVNLFLVQGVVGGVHVGGGVQCAGVGAGALVEALKILAARERQVGAGAGERPKRCVPAPGLRQIVDLGHLSGFEIKFILVQGHVCHDFIPPAFNLFPYTYNLNLGTMQKSSRFCSPNRLFGKKSDKMIKKFTKITKKLQKTLADKSNLHYNQ